MLLAISGALGGAVAFLGAVVVVVRAIARQVGATEKNTTALGNLRQSVDRLDEKIDNHENRLIIVEERTRR